MINEVDGSDSLLSFRTVTGVAVAYVLRSLTRILFKSTNFSVAVTVEHITNDTS